jgi:hypothetical protein
MATVLPIHLQTVMTDGYENDNKLTSASDPSVTGLYNARPKVTFGCAAAAAHEPRADQRHGRAPFRPQAGDAGGDFRRAPGPGLARVVRGGTLGRGSSGRRAGAGPDVPDCPWLPRVTC